MTVRARIQLRRRAGGRPAPASALFLPGRDAATVFSVCTRLGLDPSGRAYGVAGGLLLKLARPIAEPEPGATRLRELSTDLFVAADAELVPSLLDDEASGIVRDGGLVFLPGGVVLRFDRTAPLGLAALLDATPRPRREWRPMPEPLALAERVIEVSREWPEPPAEDLYREWEQDVRRPDSSRPRSRPGAGRRGQEGAGDGGADEGAADLEGAGGGSAGGLMSNLRNLGEAMRNLAGRAGSRARSVGEKFRWGMLDHSALVQKLLRELRQGDANQALRHAFSMSPADPRDRWVGWGNYLPFSRAIYNLFDLLGTSSRGGTVGIWQARPDLMEELRREYRKAAERAIREGDFRRAAYIYGKLLGDDRLAAQALQRGGLHHDAAILYLKKLNDRAAAAQAFEAAGLVDRAVALYRELGRHEAAGDLLRRIGDDAGARTEYMTAVRIAGLATPPDFFEAGRILLHKAGLADLAVQAFRCGWGQRPAANATASVLELIAIHAPRGEISPLRDLLDEADVYFKSVSSVRDAEAFYNRMATSVGNTPALSAFSEEVHDRARSALADQLRRQVESGRSPASAVSTLFGVSSLWTPSFVRDAQFAAAAADRTRDQAVKADRHTQPPGIQVGRGTVTAACQASTSAELFLGFANGQIFAFRPGKNRVVPVGTVPSPIRAIATDIDGQVVVGLYTDEHRVVLAAFLRQPDGTFLRRPDFHLPAALPTVLTPVFTLGTSRLIGLAHASELLIFEAASGLTHAHVSLTSAVHGATTALLLPYGEEFRILTHNGPQWTLHDDQGQPIGRPILGWRPVGGGVTSRCSVPLSWTCLDGLVKVVGLDADGAVHASQFWIEEGVLELLSSPIATTEGGYLAAAQTGPNRVVAVSAGRIDWLSDGSDRFQTMNSLADQGLVKTVACFPSTSPEEVLVVAAEGFISRIAVPRRSRRH